MQLSPAYCFLIAVTVLFLPRNVQGNERLTIPSPFVEMDENFVRLSMRAAEISFAVNADNTQALLPSSTSWTNEPDKVMIVRIDDICWVAFRATAPNSGDWAQNLDPRMADDVCYKGDCCRTRKGFRDAYLEFDYLEDLESSIVDCRAECCQDPNNCSNDEERCNVALTGFSQGGAIAQVAAVFLQDIAPTTITFGQPPTMEGPCPALDTDRLYRFVNTIEEGGSLKYDPIPFLDYGGVDYMGHLFVLAEDSAGVAYYEDNDAPNVSMARLSVWEIQEVHTMASHIDRLEAILGDGIFPVSMDGWDLGHLCTIRSECTFPHICSRGRCSRGAIGDSCWYEADCLSMNTCEGMLSPVCRAKLPKGSSCNEADDCQSGKCQLTWTGFKCGS